MEWLVDALLWANLQGGILAAMLLIPGVVAAFLLRGRLPVWRKGLWLGAVLLPILFVVAALLLPPADGRSLPSSWLVSTGTNSPSTGMLQGRTAVAAAYSLRLVYGMWLLTMLVLEGIAACRLRRMLGRSQDVQEGTTIALFCLLAKQVGCRSAPRLVQSTEVTSPFIVARLGRGLTVVLPSSLLATASGDLLRAVLAHELAHARAGDPWWQRVTGLVRALFPLPWVCGWATARTLWEDAAEETCDLRAVRATGLKGRIYASILTDLALSGPKNEGAECNSESSFCCDAMALGFHPQAKRALSPAAHELGLRLVRRVSGLQLATRWSEPLASSAGACCRAGLALGVLALLLRYANLGSVLHDPWSADHSRREIAGIEAAERSTVKHIGQTPTNKTPAGPGHAATFSAADVSKLPPGIRRRYESVNTSTESASDTNLSKHPKPKKPNSKQALD